MNKAVLLLGSNLGEVELNLSSALLLLQEQAGTITLLSSIYKTAPWGFEHENYFLNQVVIIDTGKTPGELLHIILEIEKKLGRIRKGTEFSARTIDIDILFFNDLVLEKDDLIIPHPLLHKRRFALIPLSELIKNYIHPVLNKSISELLLSCPDPLEVFKYKEAGELKLKLM